MWSIARKRSVAIARLTITQSAPAARTAVSTLESSWEVITINCASSALARSLRIRSRQSLCTSARSATMTSGRRRSAPSSIDAPSPAVKTASNMVSSRPRKPSFNASWRFPRSAQSPVCKFSFPGDSPAEPDSRDSGGLCIPASRAPRPRGLGPPLPDGYSVFPAWSGNDAWIDAYLCTASAASRAHALPGSREGAPTMVANQHR